VGSRWLLRAARAGVLAAGIGAVASSTGRGEPLGGTFSIVARDSITGELGVAVQSRAFNVGQAVPWAEAGVGALATQALTNMSFGPRGLELLRSGHDAEAALTRLLEADEGRESRQLGIVDARGASAVWTGSGCMAWAGGFHRPNLACQGNILAGDAVVPAMVAAFDATRGPLAERLIAALAAAQAAGGDRRGQQSAALLVVRESETHPEYRYRFVDVRVDDHLRPIDELARLYRTSLATDLADAYLELAEEHAGEGRTELAAAERGYVQEALQRALSAEETDAGSLNSLAWVSATRDLFLDEALRAAERAAELEPQSFEILDTLAEVHWHRGDFAEAVRVGERALGLSPGDGYLKGQLEKFKASLAAGRR
jgi:uncharacterized Ntn-hydrolase superfamily protein